MTKPTLAADSPRATDSASAAKGTPAARSHKRPSKPRASRSRIPGATYRLQLHGGFRFKDAIEIVPYLAELGKRWQLGTASIAQEHFASNLLRGWLAGLARGWGNGHGPRAVLACPPGELHDLALMIFGIMLNRSGWRIDYLGMITPVDELTRTVAMRRPDLVVLAATLPERLEPLAPQLTSLAQHTPLALAGAGATPELADAVGARLLTGDPVTEAENVEWPL